MTDTILIHFDWDSCPVSKYYEADENTRIDPVGHYPNGGSGPVVPVPVEAWQRYADAMQELLDAEEALLIARDASIRSIMPSHP